MKNEPILSVIDRLMRTGLPESPDDFEKDLYALVKAMPEKYVSILVQKERDELEEKLRGQIEKLKEEKKKLEAQVDETCKANLRLADELLALEAQDEGSEKLEGALAKVMQETEVGE